MAPIEKKSTFVAPGKLAMRSGLGLKANFLPSFLSKTPSSSNSIGNVTSSKATNSTISVKKVSQTLVTKEIPGQNVSTLGKSNQSSKVTVGYKENPVPNIGGMNQTTTNKALNEMGLKNITHSRNMPERLQEELFDEVHEDDFLQRSINNDAMSNLLEQNVSEVGTQVQDEVTTPLTKKRNRNPNAKPRGVNQCKKVASLKEGQKLQVDIYNKGPVGDYQKDMTRHIGKLVRHRTICPVRVHSWDEIDAAAKEHMWLSVLNKFSGKGLELDRKTTLDHLKRLWHNWRGILNQNSIIKKGGPENALKVTPNDLTPDDWEWLVKAHFSSPAFQKVSARNSVNRGQLKMLHHTGSQPFRQIIWEEMGGKEGKEPPPISHVFKRTRKEKSGYLDENNATKYDEIVAVETENPSLSQFEVVEKCFGPQDRGSVVCFGSGVRPSYVRGPLPSRADLTSIIHEKDRENEDLRKRIDEIEANYQKEREIEAKRREEYDKKLDMLMSAFLQQSSGCSGDQTRPNGY